MAWQSAGRTPEPWLGPDVRDVVRQLAEAGDVDGVVVCPIGFVTDHLEVLYDLDVELAAVAAEVGLPLARTASLNDDRRFIDVLADVVMAADRGTATEPTWRRVVVVGGGISGLAAAWELSGGPTGVDADRGGTLGSGPRRGARVDVPARRRARQRASSAVASSIRVPTASSDGAPRHSTSVTRSGWATRWSRSPGAAPGVWARGRVRPLPDGLALGIPTRFWPAARSGILGLRGQLGLARDALLPRPDVRGPHRRPLHRPAGGAASSASGWPTGWWTPSSAASTPARWTTCRPPPPIRRSWRPPRRRGSLMRALRAEVPAPAPADDAPPLFWALDGGMASLVEQLRAALDRPRGGDPLRHARCAGSNASTARAARRGGTW